MREPERQRILEMLQQGKESVDEAAKLLAAVDTHPPLPPARTLRVRVVGSKGESVNVNLPISLAKVILGLLPEHLTLSLSRQQVNLAELIEGITAGEARGKIVDVVGQHGERVEITVE